MLIIFHFASSVDADLVISGTAVSSVTSPCEMVGSGLRWLSRTVSRVITNLKRGGGERNPEGHRGYSGDNLRQAETWEYFVFVLLLNQRSVHVAKAEDGKPTHTDVRLPGARSQPRESS